MNDQVVQRQRKYKRQAIAYKGGACVSCGFDLHQSALDFHHLDPSQKDSKINAMARSPLTGDVRKELDKCALLCATCHRLAHAGLVTFTSKRELLKSPFRGE